MILVNICYITVAVGVSKILTFYSWNFSVLINIPQSCIPTGLTLGTIGSLLGKSICGYFTNKYSYNSLLTVCFLLIGICFTLEFMSIVTLTISSFYLLRIIQGFLSGLIYSAILANLGEFYEKEMYQKLLTVLTGGLGIAGPIFAFLYIFFSFEILIKLMFFVPLVGALTSYWQIKNRSPITKPHKKRTLILRKYLSIILQERYLWFFALSFSLVLISSLVILANIHRLLLVELSRRSICLSSKVIKFISVIPLLLGSGSFLMKKTHRNYMCYLISILILFILNFIMEKLALYLIFFTFCYGIHLLIIPYASGLILESKTEDKDYYSYIIHAIRSLFYSVLVWTFFSKFNFTNFYSLSIFCGVVNMLAGLFYFIGRYYLGKKI